MDVYEMLERVDGPDTFLEFARALHADRTAEEGKRIDAWGPGANGWENHTIEDFLEAAITWGENTDMGASQGLEGATSWQRCAAFLYCGKIYE